jgi:protein TonB
MSITPSEPLREAPRRPDRVHNSRFWPVSGAVLVAHIALLWTIEQDWLEQVWLGPAPTIEETQVIMASVLVESPTLPALQAKPHPQPQPQPKTVTPVAPQPQPTSAPTPLPRVSMSAEASPPTPVVAPVVAAASNAQATPFNPVNPVNPVSPTAAASLSVGKPAPASLVLPSSDADYLNNPPPAYPRMSKRMGEQGTVIVRVLIGLQGSAEQAEIRTSSGYDRLDKAALETVQRWRYSPGKRHGNPEAMWFNVPVRFVLE